METNKIASSSQHESSRWLSRRLMALIPLLAIALVSCLGEPEIDERWTKLEMMGVDPLPGQTLSASQPIDVNVNARVTYRSVITGFVVAEARYSDTIDANSLVMTPTQHNLTIAQNVDYVLANSVTAGRATRIVTGWDHLMQDIDLSFTATVPAAMFANGSTPTGGMFLVMYMGEGEEIELSDGSDSLVVTPFRSTDYEVLHTGFALDVTP